MGIKVCLHVCTYVHVCVVHQEARKSGQTVKEVKEEVHSLLEEIGHKFYLPSLRLLGFIARSAVMSMYKNIFINKMATTQVY